jgi:hypothetical protein
MLLRNDHDQEQDKKRYKWMQQNIFLPFVAASRRQHDNWTEGMPIPSSLTAVHWCDGDSAQLRTIVEEETLDTFASLNIIANKQHAARTGTEQAADLTKTFKIMHRMQSSVTVQGERHLPLKQNLETEFNQLYTEGILRLPPKKRNALIDCLASSPETATKAISRSHVQQGFVSNGMIDANTKELPDFDRLLATCRTEIPLQLYNKIERDFPLLLKYELEHGDIPDWLYEELGYPMDKDMDGREVRRNATISQENRQRSKCLSHSHQKELRKKKQNEIDAAKARTIAEETNNLSRLIMQNTAAEDKLIAGTGKSRDKISELSKEYFKRPTGPELKAFVHMRKFDTYKLPPGAPKWPKNKGKLVDIDATPRVDCFLQQAWEARNNVVKLKHPRKLNDKLTPGVGVAVAVTPLHAMIRVIANDSPIRAFGKASSILQSDGFLETVNKCFNASRNFSIAIEVNDEMMLLGDQLQKSLSFRLTAYKEVRLLDPSKHSHWCMLWFMQNLPVVSAIMVAMNHSKIDLGCLSHTDCLLSNESNFHLATNSESKLEGCYLYFDRNRSVWVRSGKVTNRSFSVRHEEHSKAARKEFEKQFYCWFPSKQCSSLTSNLQRRGWFENLTQYVALGINRSVGDALLLLTSDRVTEQGLFHFDKETKKRIDSVKFQGNLTLQDKQMHMVAYLIELGYDLALASENNASSSPGFETPMGVF